MDTPKQTVSVLFIFSIILFLCFSNKCDFSSIISLFSDIYQLINRRNMILLCNFILLFIVKDSGLLSSGRNELSVYKENRVAPLEKEREFEVKEVQLEEEIRESYIDRSLDIVAIENRNEVIETNEEEEQMEKMESSREEEVWDWEVMQRRELEEELEKECVCVIEQNGEDEIEKESVEELHKKIEEFIGKMKRQIVSEIEVSMIHAVLVKSKLNWCIIVLDPADNQLVVYQGVAAAETTLILLLRDAGSPA